MPARDPRHGTCLVTVTDAGYLPGTLVLLSSFLRHNPWFKGSIVVIHDGLSAPAWKRLARFPGLTGHRPGEGLKARLRALVARRPEMARNLSRFYSLEAFGLVGRDHVLYLDSDVLCTGSVKGLLEMEGALVACPDQAHLRGRLRDRSSFLAAPREPGDPPSGAHVATFNAGVMLLRPPLLGPSVHAALLEALRPELWDGVRTGHTDQVVLNRCLHDRWVSGPERYNYLISGNMAGYRRRGGSLDDAALVHFLGRPKPWQRPAEAVLAEGEAVRREAFARWDAAWRAYAADRLRDGLDARPLVELGARASLRLAARLRRGLRHRLSRDRS